MKLRLSLLAIPLLALSLAGCTRSGNSAFFVSSGIDGEFSATDQLDAEGSLAGETVLSLATHPTRKDVFFAGIAERGVVVSKDGGQTWQSTGLSIGSPSDLVLHPQASQTLYAAVDQNVMRSTDDGVSFASLYADPGEVLSIAIDPAAPQNVWIGTDQGSLVHSANAGSTWQVAQRFNAPITDILISSLGSAIVVGTAGEGLQVSADRGETFVERTPLKDERTLTRGTDEIIAIAQAAKVGSPLMIATSAGLFSSADLGQTWNTVDSPVAEAGTLSGLGASQAEPSLVVAVAEHTVATSTDSGATWTLRDTDTDRTLGPVGISGSTVIVGVIGEGRGFLERALN